FKELARFQDAELKRKKRKTISNKLKFKGFTFEEIESFINTMYEAHELAMEKFMRQHSDSDGEILIDSMLAIRDMEKCKVELMTRGL
ncbi:MAG: hypothetical protein ACTSX4_03840, partial [Candidatus Helarchaeota archaeon]